MSKKGFTLIETLVAVTILTLAAAGPLALAAKTDHFVGADKMVFRVIL